MSGNFGNEYGIISVLYMDVEMAKDVPVSTYQFICCKYEQCVDGNLISNVEYQNKQVFRREVVFLIDTSGSMQRKPIESVKNAVFASLLELTDLDFFNIVSFSDEVCSFSTCLVPATEEMVESANQWMGTNLVAKGGTNISRPLNEVHNISEILDCISWAFVSMIH
jgi:uncharacterized protein with von Willebrand factor type A (vWA) domain